MKRLVIHYDPRLLEEAVFHACQERHIRREFDQERNRIYDVADADEREKNFSRLYRRWFERLGLSQPIEEALSEQSLIGDDVGECFILCAVLVKDEGAELFIATGREPAKQRRCTLRILIRPQTLLRRESALAFLRHELFHISDMLDPGFAYEPALPKTDGGPTYDSLMVSRYRVLWDTTINGRMVRRGWLPNEVREQQLDEFRRTFPMLGERTEESFERFFDADQPRHVALAAFALDPRAAIGQVQMRTAAGTHCSLCKFPTHSFEPEPENLPDHVLAAIRRDFPHWTPAQGVCIQCAGLYQARELSTAAALALPGAPSC